MAKRKRKKVSARDRVPRMPCPDVTAFVRQHLHPDAPSAVPLRKMWRDIIDADEIEAVRPMIPMPTPFIHNGETSQAWDGEFDGRDAYEALAAIHDTFVDKADQLVSQLGTAECLFWLRRLRGQFAMVNNLVSTEPYVQLVAEALVTRAARPSEPIDDLAEMNYYLNEEKLLLLVTIHILAAEIYELHSVMKRCAKGQVVQFTPAEMPTWVRDSDLDELIKRLDQRTMKDDAGSLTSLGIASRADPLERPRLPIGGHVPLWYSLHPRTHLPFSEVDPQPYLVGSVNLDPVQAVNPDEPLDEAQVALVALLWACHAAMGEPKVGLLRMTPMFQWGYAILHTEGTLLPYLDRTLTEMREHGGAALSTSPKIVSGVEVLNILGKLSTEVNAPMAGNPVHPVADRSVIDLVGASRRLVATLTRPRDGNVRPWTERFEDDVQAVIDNSPWRPEKRVRGLKGKKIRRLDGTELTDIDAVAIRGKQLLLVSCKSFAVTREVVQGSFRVTPTSLDRSHKALTKWTAVVDVIRHDPGLLGFSLPSDIAFDGCIVFPVVPYYTEPAGDRRAFRNIPVLLSISEFEKALQK